jgi:hypothetical protein
VFVFGGIQGGETGILASFQLLVGPQSSTYPEFPDSLRGGLLGNSMDLRPEKEPGCREPRRKVGLDFV